ncbi:MAG: LysR substrate-binding domain-containing protein [Gammaproteobacteria bacterium]|jgi:LysR family hydrogen peroxide-inducible transcriptional activator|nr:LysR substrate-binding domain-containing protein [Gammaproteobacteria bacterium]
MKHLPTLRSLQYLVALHDEANFGRAANACAVSQSTLSSAILNLEEQLGGVLVERTNKTLTFTALGLALVERARPLLVAAGELTEIAHSWSGELKGPLKLGVIPTITPFLLPQLLARVGQRFPLLEPRIKEDFTHRLLDDLHQGALDIALIALPWSAPNIATVAIGRDPFLFVCHRDNPLASAPPADVSDIPEGKILLLEEGHCLRQHAIDACRLREASRINQYSLASLHTLVQMVNLDLGVSFLPQLAIDAGILHGTEVVASDAGAAGAYRDIGLAWRRSSIRSNEFLALAREVESLLTP